MGIKAKETVNNNSSEYKIEDLIFSSSSGYYILKNIDHNAQQLVDAMKAGSLDMKEFFGRFEKTKVKETQAGAVENLEFLFPEISRFICLDDPDYFKTELDFADNFYSLMDIEYFD